MEVILKVVDGPEIGREFHFEEADNLLIGRQDPSSQAQLQISPEDRFVSRNHFIIQIRPPNVMVRDNGSRNGTFIRNKDQTDWGKRIDEALVDDGDQIKIGHTILAVNVVRPEPVSLPTFFESAQEEVKIQEEEKILPPEPKKESAEIKRTPPPEPKKEPAEVKPAPQPKAEASPEFLCIRCGEPLENPPALQLSFHQEDFMCEKCRKEVLAERKKEAAARAAVQYKCHHCGADVTKAANEDGRAADLADSALYLCKDCANRAAKGPTKLIGDYRILSELGRGGMGVVFKAWHPHTWRMAALKQMLPIAKINELQLRRFMRETMIMADLQHFALVRLFEAGLDGKNPFFVSEFVTEGNLNQFLSPEDRPLLKPVEAARLIADALEGLQHFHKKGYVHRDIKPENILLGPKANGQPGKSVKNIQPKLADFGLSRSYEKHGGTITRKGEYAGTIFYMPGEQIISFKESRPPVDVYAMGVTLYYLLTGRFSLDFPSPSQLKRGAMLTKDPIRMILEDQPRPVRSRQPDLPPALCAIVDKAVAKEAKQRYQTAQDFRDDLLKFIG